VLGYLALAAVASCALTVGVAVVLVRHKLATQRSGNLQAQANVLAVAGGAPGVLRAGEHVYRVGTGRPRPLRPRIAAAVLAALPTTGDGQGALSVNGRSLIYAARRTANGRVVLIRAAHLAFAEWRPFLFSLVLAGLGGAALAALLSWLLARRLARPIGELALATGRVAAGESGVEVPVQGEDEMAGLGRSFNAMSAELTRAREADRLERLVSDLLDLARLGREGFGVERRPVDLAAVSRTAVQRNVPRARELGVELSAGRVAGRRGPAPRLRSLLPVQPLSLRACRGVGTGAGDRQGADRRDGRRRGAARRPGGGAEFTLSVPAAAEQRPAYPVADRSGGDRAL
jgi:HAMP domain-containing protein